MTNKKDVIIVVLATFCLTSTLFMIRSTLSNPGLGEYDPWIDNNEDGTVDILDAIGLSNVFDTSGDPTKNVNVTNWPTEESVFPEILRFYGVRRRLSDPSQAVYENSLTDHIEVFEWYLEPVVTSPVYKMSPGEIKVLTDYNIALESSFVRTFQVKGTARIFWEYLGGGTEWIYHNVSLILQKILSDGGVVPIGSKDYRNVQGGTSILYGYAYMNVTETFYPGEKLALRIIDVATNIQSYQIDVATSLSFCYYFMNSYLFIPYFNLYIELPLA